MALLLYIIMLGMHWVNKTSKSAYVWDGEDPLPLLKINTLIASQCVNSCSDISVPHAVYSETRLFSVQIPVPHVVFSDRGNLLFRY